MDRKKRNIFLTVIMLTIIAIGFYIFAVIIAVSS